jgi:hypothetical protein
MSKFMITKSFSSPTEILECRCCNKSFSEKDNIKMYKWDVPTLMPRDFKDIYCYNCHFNPMRERCTCYPE